MKDKQEKTNSSLIRSQESLVVTYEMVVTTSPVLLSLTLSFVMFGGIF